MYENAPLNKKPFSSPSLSHLPPSLLPQPQQQTLLTPVLPSTPALSSNCSSINRRKWLHYASKRPREILLPTQANSSEEDLQPHNVKYPRTLPDIDAEVRPTPISSPIELSPDSLTSGSMVSANGKQGERARNMQVILHPTAATPDDTAINHLPVDLVSMLCRRSPLLHGPSNSSLLHWPASATPLLQEIYESLQQRNRINGTEEGEGDSMPMDTPPLQQASSPLTSPQNCTDIEVENESRKLQDMNCSELSEERREAHKLPTAQTEEEMMME
jgi:hypothetical protein